MRQDLFDELVESVRQGGAILSELKKTTPAKIVVLEGIDGSGKRTQTQFLRQKACGYGRRVAVVSYPDYTHGVYGNQIAKYLRGDFGGLDDVDPRFAALLFAGNRLELRGRIDMLRHMVDLILIDRYTASNIAFQGARVSPLERNTFRHWITEIEYDAHKLPEADQTFFLYVDPKVAYNLILQKQGRTYTNSLRDLHEQDLTLLERASREYANLAVLNFKSKWDTIFVTDFDGELVSPEYIADAIWGRIIW